MTRAFGSPLVPAEHCATRNDVPARHLTTVVYPPTDNVTAATITAETIAAERRAIAEACTATAYGCTIRVS
jgi:hypothetical protein